MDSPAITREVYKEAEHRMTGGPDAVAAFELLPPEARSQIEGDPEIAQKAIELAWATWLDLTVKLQSLGFPARTLCDASNTVAEAWEQKSREGAREHA